MNVVCLFEVEELQKLKPDEQLEKEMKLKARVLGNMRFIGELFKIGMLGAKYLTMDSCSSFPFLFLSISFFVVSTFQCVRYYFLHLSLLSLSLIQLSFLFPFLCLSASSFATLLHMLR